MDLSWGNAFSFPVVWLATFVLALLLAAKCLVQMVFGRSPPFPALEGLAVLVATALAFILGLDALTQKDSVSFLPPAAVPLVAVGLGLTFVAAHLSVALLHFWRHPLATEPAAWVAVALTLGTSAWSSNRHAVANLKIELVKASYCAGDAEIRAVHSWVAVTDRGRELPLFRFELKPGTAVGQGQGSPANCHGWVFCSGQYFLQCEDVEKILADNGYQIYDSPRVGDLVVYRNSSGGISHTGVVKECALAGPPVIESKWGLRGRFVHSPADQPYGRRFGYYRSTRQGHTLAIRPAAIGASVASN
jgi:hypothetical protein